MKHLPWFVAAIWPCLTFPAFSREILPDWKIENRTSSDGSGTQCLTFTATRGMEYVIESSDDLGSWQVEAETYGLGQDVATPMRQILPPPAPDPLAPPQVPIYHPVYVSIAMVPCSDAGGGIVVSWPSFETGAAMSVRIEGTMAADWQYVPL